MAVYRLGEEIVGFAGDRDGFGGLKLLDAGRIELRHLHIDACRIHGGDSPAVEVAELFKDPGHGMLGIFSLFFYALAGPREKCWAYEMFFKSDRPHNNLNISPASSVRYPIAMASQEKSQ